MEFRGIVRSHPFLIFLPFAALVTVAAPELVLFAFESRDAMQAQVGISAALFFATLAGLLAGATSLPRERATGLGDLLLASPLAAGAWIFGKWLGILAAVVLAVALLGGVHLASVTLRGGAPLGVGPLLAALVPAVVQGALAASAALAFGARWRAGPALVGALLLVLAGHAAGLLGPGPVAEVVAFLLPRAAALNLAAEASFGPFGPALWLVALLHGVLYSLAMIALAATAAAGQSASS